MARRKLVHYLVVLTILLVAWPAGTVHSKENHCLNCHRPHPDRSADCAPCHAGNPRTGRKSIAHDRFIPARLAYFTETGHPVMVRGNSLLQEFGCRRCHVIGGEGIRAATNLDHLPPRVTGGDLERAIARPAIFMPTFLLTPSDLAALVNVLLAGRAKAPPLKSQAPRTVHFTPREELTPRVFVARCGPCHQFLSVNGGILGHGQSGPNLSSLLTRFYPTPLREAEPWRIENLKSWLDNPRKFRPAAKMPPRPLTAEEWSKLQQDLTVPKDSLQLLPSGE